MITRAQAEALLTLAESLEACERLGVTLTVGGRNYIDVEYSPAESFTTDLTKYANAISAIDLRLRIAEETRCLQEE
jgi:hypothetical protein